MPRNSLKAEISVAGYETGSGSGVGAETSLKVGSGSGVGSETNHSGSTTLIPSTEMEFLDINLTEVSFALCYSQSLLLADFKENHTLSLAKKSAKHENSSLFMNNIL